MTTSALKKYCVKRADVVIGPYAVDKLTTREIGICGLIFNFQLSIFNYRCSRMW